MPTMHNLSKKEMLADIAFLLERAGHAGSCSFVDDGRETGRSSNSIVAIAYGATPLEQQALPCDSADLRACQRMWEKLPPHRRTKQARLALKRAQDAVRT